MKLRFENTLRGRARRSARAASTPIAFGGRVAAETEVRALDGGVAAGWIERPIQSGGKPRALQNAKRRARSDAPYLRAFTLIELMVVITVIAIVTGVMVMEMGGTYEDALLRTNARKLIDVCDAASNRAIAAQQAQVLKIDAASGHFAVRAKAQEMDEKEAFLTEGDLDKRIALMIREPARGEEAEESEQPAELGAITFYPDGSADAREFAFRDRAGVEVVLRINPTTSRVRIIEMAAQ